MQRDILTWEVFLDTSVNAIPFAILAVFFVLYLAVSPWGTEFSLARIIQICLIALPAIGLTVLTYEAAKRIER